MATQYSSSAPTNAKNSAVPLPADAFNPTNNHHQKVEKSMKTYQVAQQVEYLHLQAEIDVLLQKLQALSKQPQKSDYASSQSDR
jgi:polyhydroxyalkanoate synthesis regulator phasin